MLRLKTWSLACSLLGCVVIVSCTTNNNTSSALDNKPSNKVTNKGNEVVVNKLSDLVMADGSKVSNCEDYQLARQTQLVEETVSNQILLSEYLHCSLAETMAIDVKDASSIAQQLMNLRVRQIPLSLAQQYGRKTIMVDADFQQSNEQLLWQDGYHKVSIQVKAKAYDTQNRYLIWVSDVISDAQYHAYYPAWVDLPQDSDEITAMPIYQSGY